jgi:transcriptional regulator with XRE-family HTH domain
MRIYIREWRKHLGISAVVLADALDIERASYLRLEREPGKINLAELAIIENVLGVRPAQLGHPPPTEGQPERLSLDDDAPENLGNSQKSYGPHFLREWREWSNYTLEDAGESVGLSHAQLSRIERRLQPYKQEYLETLAKLYGAPGPAALIDRNCAPTTPHTTCLYRGVVADL